VAAHLEPDLLIVDEVLSVGDFIFQAKSIEKMRAVRRNGATVIFVSHNLRAMADLCERALLLKKGQLIQDGPTSQVIHTYMEHARAERSNLADKQVYIESVTFGDAEGQRFDFRSGDKVRVEIKVRSPGTAARVSCVLYLLDDNYYEVFEVTSEHLLGAPRDFNPGDEVTYVVDLDLNVSSGNFQLCALLYRHYTGTVFDKIEPAATLMVTNPIPVRGVVDLRPRMTVIE
jgi:lipopolysaccharide transport system ATP-binding protein